jgi:hypothetical protein
MMKTGIQHERRKTMRRVIFLVGIIFLLMSVTDVAWRTDVEAEVSQAAEERIPPKVDLKLRALWRAMVERLVSKDIDGALDYFSPEMRFIYKARLSRMVDSLPQAFTRLRDIEPGFLQGNRALYRLRESDPQGEVTYRIWFILDADGTWKIDEF